MTIYLNIFNLNVLVDNVRNNLFEKKIMPYRLSAY